MPFLWIGTMFDFLHIFGNIPYWIHFLKISDKGFTTSAPQICSNLLEISAWTWSLFILSDFIIFRIFSSLKLIVESLFSVQYIIVDDKMLSFTMGVHCEAKQLLKKFAFYLKFVITLLSIIIGEIKGIFVPL